MEPHDEAATKMSQLIDHLQQIPAPLAMVIAVGAFAAQLDFRVARQERRRGAGRGAKETHEFSS
jgi:hypothetical protein